MTKENNEKEDSGLADDIRRLAVQDEFMEKMATFLGVEKEEDIIVQCGGIRLRIFEAGEYESKKEAGKLIHYEAGIEIRQGASQGGIRMLVNASDLALLGYHTKNNTKASIELSKRLKVERDILAKAGF